MLVCAERNEKDIICWVGVVFVNFVVVLLHQVLLLIYYCFSCTAKQKATMSILTSERFLGHFRIDEFMLKKVILRIWLKSYIKAKHILKNYNKFKKLINGNKIKWNWNWKCNNPNQYAITKKTRLPNWLKWSLGWINWWEL